MSERAPSTTVSALRALGLSLLCAKVVLVPLFFDPSALVVFAQPKALLSQALGLVLLAVMLGLFIAGERPKLAQLRSFVPLASFAIVYVLSTATALDQNLALYGAHDRSLGLFATLDVILLFVAARSFVRGAREARIVAVPLFVAPLALMAYEAVQLLGMDPLPWASGFGRARPFASMGNAAVLAQYLGTLAPAAALLAIVPSDLGRRQRGALAVLAALFAIGAVLTGTRAVVLGLGTGALVVALSWAFLRSTPRARVGVGIGIVVLLTGAVVAGLTTPLSRALQTVLVGAPSLAADGTVAPEGSVSGRLILYQVALSQFRDRPLLGVGPDNYVAAFPRYRPETGATALASDAPQTSSHSWLARLATDAGSAGLAAFVVVLAFAVSRTVRATADSRLVAVAGLAAVASFLATGLVSINDVGSEWLLWLALAAMTGRLHVAGDGAEAQGTRVGRRRRMTRARAPIAGSKWPLVLVLVATVLALTAYRALDASHAAETARRASARGDTQVAVSSGIRATELDPIRAEYWNGRGLGLTRIGDFRAAESAFLHAVELAPYQFVYRTNLARAQLAIADAGGRARALETAQRAVQTDPNNAETHYTLALVLAASGRSAEALPAIERAAQLKPNPADRFFHETAASVYLAVGRPQDAERWARYGLVRIGGTREAFDTRLLLARALLAQDRRSEALTEVQRVLDEEATHAAALRLRAEIQSGS